MYVYTFTFEISGSNFAGLTFLSLLDCFTANYIIGVGLLGVPNAFSKAGLLLSPLILLFGSALSLLTIVWLVEVRSLPFL